MNVRTIEDGEIICEPGIYDMSIEWYHQQCCDGPSISSGGIRSIIKSPAEYWRTSHLNPNRVEEEGKEAYTLGRAAHHLLLGEKNFARHFVKQPDAYVDPKAGEKKWNNNATVCREWHAEQAAAGRTVITDTQLEKIKGMAGLLPWQKGMTNCGLANTPLIAQGGALSGEIERSLIFKVGNIWVKSRPDAIPSSNDIVDLKTISPRGSDGLSDRALSMAVFDHGYHVQGAVVGMGLKEVLGRQMESFNLAFVDTGNVHAVSVKGLDEADIVLGERAVFAALRIFEHCLETGIWPGPTARQADAQRLSIPSWGREQIERHLDIIEKEVA